ncbi:MAG: N-acetyl-gamma-glutamyl-phosphate reductase [Woeseiaceae bacterium]|nr:N-acetyl-gamma-glutamyl-phosphate reductase [Woeseiaceae bacterium]
MISVSIVGGSGYSGGELIRLLTFHSEVEIRQITSERLAGKFVHNAHPNMRGVSKLKFCSIDELKSCDVMFMCLPHGQTMHRLDEFKAMAGKLIDLSGDFRLSSDEAFQRWYGKPHACPERLGDFVYGIPELHRDAIAQADAVASAGCNATASILALNPLYKRGLAGRTIIEVKTGSSEGGNSSSDASHHPERSGVVRSYKPTGHRHVGEMVQEFGADDIHFSATSIEMVRGILATCHVFLNETVAEKEIWKIYREAYADEPFVRIVKERSGIHRYPEPKLLAGSNFCDIGFERDPHSDRLVVISAIDNLMKGAAGQAVQAFNIMHGFEETMALTFPGLHPI